MSIILNAALWFVTGVVIILGILCVVAVMAIASHFIELWWRKTFPRVPRSWKDQIGDNGGIVLLVALATGLGWMVWNT